MAIFAPPIGSAHSPLIKRTCILLAHPLLIPGVDGRIFRSDDYRAAGNISSARCVRDRESADRVSTLIFKSE
jgi:hypothetical protein